MYTFAVNCAAVVAAATLFVNGSAYAQSTTAAQPAPSVEWVGDSGLAVAVDLARYWNGTEKASLRELSGLHPFVLTWWLKDAEEFVGVSAGDVSRVVALVEGNSQWVVAAEMVEKGKTRAIHSALAPHPEVKMFGDRPLYTGDQCRLVHWSEKTVLIANEAPPLQSLLARLDAGEKAALPPIQQNGAPLLELCVAGEFLVNKFDESAAADELKPLFAASAVRIAIDPSEGIRLRAAATFKDEEAARAGVAAMKYSATTLEQYVRMCQENMPTAVERFAAENEGAAKLGPLIDRATKAASVGLAKAEVSQEGNTVHLTVLIESAEPVTDAIVLLSLMPRASK